MSNIEQIMETRVRQFNEVYKDRLALYIEKNTNYNDSFRQQVEEFGLISAITRLNDKLTRFKALATKEPLSLENSPSGESIMDTLLDLSNFADMTSMYLREVLTENATSKKDDETT